MPALVVGDSVRRLIGFLPGGAGRLFLFFIKAKEVELLYKTIITVCCCITSSVSRRQLLHTLDIVFEMRASNKRSLFVLCAAGAVRRAGGHSISMI